MSKFKFALGAAVVLITSLLAAEEEAEHDRRPAEVSDGILRIASFIESGQVIARSEYLYDNPMYRVRYRAGDGRQVEDWFSGEALASDPRFPQSGEAVGQATDDLNRHFAEARDRVAVAAKAPFETSIDNMAEAAKRAIYTLGKAFAEVGENRSVNLNVFDGSRTIISLSADLP